MKVIKTTLFFIMAATSCLSYASENLSSVDRQDAAIRKIRELRSKKSPAAQLEIKKLQALIEKLEADRTAENRYQAKLARSRKEHIQTHYPRYQELTAEIENLERRYVRKFDELRTSNQENKEDSLGKIGMWKKFPGLSRKSREYMTRYHKARLAALEKEESERGNNPDLQEIDRELEALQKEQDDLGL